MTTRRRRHVAAWLAAGTIGGAGLALAPALATGSAGDHSLDAQLTERLSDAGFTGRIESTLTERLGRPLDPRRADTGRLLWFDTILGLNDDNACAGSQRPAAGRAKRHSVCVVDWTCLSAVERFEE